MRMILSAVAAATCAVVLTGCGDANYKDLKNVPAVEPTHVEVYTNIDQHPNIVMMCIHGKAFITTTRERFALLREADLDLVCAEKAG